MKVWELRDGFGLDHLVPAERPIPVPGPGQVVVRIRAASLNYRDLLTVKGLYNPRLPLPRVPLSDGVGEVTAVGEGVSRLRSGERVAGIFCQGWLAGEPTDARCRTALGGDLDGVLAEYVLFDAEGVVPVPGHLSDEEAATLPCAAVTAWHALVTRGQVKSGDAVLVLGTGGVSLFALQLARLHGARVLVTSSSDVKLARAQQLGASDGINYRDTPEWDQRVRELTDGRGVDHVVEVGGAGTLPRSLRAVRTGGQVSLIGVLAGGTGAEVNPMPILMRQIRVQGIYTGSREMFEAMNRAIELHKLRPVVDQVYRFDQVHEALRTMEVGAHFGKIVLRLD